MALFSAAKTRKVVNTVADLRSLTSVTANGLVTALGYYKINDRGGGDYVWDATSTLDDDGGGVIKPISSTYATKGRFIQVITGDHVNLKRWGIRAQQGHLNWNDSYDLIIRFEAAVKFCLAMDLTPKIYIPNAGQMPDGTGYNYYYCSRTLRITTPIIIFGDGFPDKPTTRLGFPSHTTCIESLDIHNNLTIDILNVFQQLDGNNFGNRNAHGIFSRSIVQFKGVHVTSADGAAFFLQGCMQPTSPIYGSTDHARLDNCYGHQCDFGIRLDGCDANKILTVQCHFSNIRRWGRDDNSFLGCTDFAPHYAFCGSGNSNEAAVWYKGQFYYVNNQISDEFVLVGKEPDLYPQYWTKATGNADMHADEWKADKRYYSGGPIRVSDPNAWTNIFDPYFEGSQPPSRLNSRSKVVINGTPGASTSGGSVDRVLFGMEYGSARRIYPALLLCEAPFGDTGPQALLHTYGKQGNIADVVHETDYESVWMLMKNKHEEGKLSFYSDLFNFHKGVTAPTIQMNRPKTADSSTSLKTVVWDENTGELKVLK